MMKMFLAQSSLAYFFNVAPSSSGKLKGVH